MCVCVCVCDGEWGEGGRQTYTGANQNTRNAPEKGGGREREGKYLICSDIEESTCGIV